MVIKQNYRRKEGFHKIKKKASKNYENDRRIEGNCYNCGKSDHIKKYYWFKKPIKDNCHNCGNNVIISSLERQVEDEWNAKASFVKEGEEIALTMIIDD